MRLVCSVSPSNLNGRQLSLIRFLSFPVCIHEQEHVEGYMELSAKTKQYFATAVGLWDADFYVKVDDDVHVNIGKGSFLFPSLYSIPTYYVRGAFISMLKLFYSRENMYTEI